MKKFGCVCYTKKNLSSNNFWYFPVENFDYSQKLSNSGCYLIFAKAIELKFDVAQTGAGKTDAGTQNYPNA